MSVFTGEINKKHHDRTRIRDHLEMNAFEWNMNLLSKLSFPGAAGIFTELWMERLQKLVSKRKS